MKRAYLIILGFCFICSVSAQLDRSKKPKSGPPPEILLGNYESFSLKNGLTIFVVEDHKIPVVSINLYFDNDPVLEENKTGAADMVGQMMRSGTTSRTKQQLDEEIDFIGATLNASTSGMYGSALKKHEKTLLELFSDILYNPVFPEKELEKIKRQTISALASVKTNANAISSNLSQVLLFGKNHPYGEIITEETVQNITINDIKKYYENYFRPDNAYLVVVGDVNYESIRIAADKYFSIWENAEIPTYNNNSPVPIRENRVVFVDKPGAVQSHVTLLHPVILHPGSKDLIKLGLMNFILGGNSFSNRLNMNLREDKAFTYGAYSNISPDKLIGSFKASSQVRNIVTDSTVTEILYEINKMKKEKVSFDDLELAKNQMAGNFARSLENPQTIARFALNIKLYDLPEDYYKNYLKNINAVSVDDVQEMAVKYLKPENLIILVVGNRDEVAEKLIKFSSKDIIEYYDIYGNPLMEVPKVIPEGMTYEYVIASYLNNIGGKKKLSEIKNIYTKIHAELNVQGQQMEASITSFKKAPDLFKSVTYMGDMLIQKQIFDGEKGLSASVSGEVAITGKQLEELKLQSVIFPELHYKDLGYKLKLLLIEKLKGNYAYKIEIISPLGNKQYDYFDIDTGMLIRSLNTTESPSGEITTITDFSDYKDVNGIKFPHFMEINAGPQLIKINIVSIDIKSEIDNKEFIIEK